MEDATPLLVSQSNWLTGAWVKGDDVAFYKYCDIYIYILFMYVYNANIFIYVIILYIYIIYILIYMYATRP